MSDLIVELIRELDADRMKDLQKFIESSMREEKQVLPMLPEDTVGASIVEDFCPRREAIRIENNIVLLDVIEPKTARTFAFGHAFERWLRDNVLAKRRIILGKWKCLCCGHIPEKVNDAPRYPKPEACPRCESKILLDAHAEESPKYKGMRHREIALFSYVEEYQRDERTKVGGYIDAFMYWNRKYYILEIKTVNANRFRLVKSRGAFAAHRAQIQIYMKKTGYRHGVIWYFNKDTSEEILVYVDYDHRYASFQNRKGLLLQEYFGTKRIPARLCPDAGCPRAKKCATAELCFTRYAGV